MSIKRKVLNTRGGTPLVTPESSYIVRVLQFQAVTFYDTAQQRQIIVLYSLGEDGIIREYGGNAWKPYPITKDL
jgi:hypothetical protein